MKKILILGSEGFTGRYFFEFLKNISIKSKIILVDKVPKKSIPGENYHKIDLLKKREISAFLRHFKPGSIFNFIGLNFSNNIWDLFKLNVFAVDNLLSSIQEIKNYTPKVLLVGSAAEYGNVNESDLPIRESCKKKPVSNYGLSKVYLDKLAKKYILNSKIKIFRTKTFNIMGPGISEKLIVGSIALQIEKIRKGIQPPVLQVGNLHPERDFIDIRDVVIAYWKIMNSDFAGEAFNIGSGRPVKVRKVVDSFVNFSELKMKIEQREKLVKKIDMPRSYAAISKIRKKINWTPKIPFEQSIKDILNFRYLK